MADRLTCFICNEPMVKSKTSKPQGQAAHNKCRANGAGRKHGASGYRGGCRCTICREYTADRMRTYTARRTATDGVSPTSAHKRKKRGMAPDATWDCFVCGLPLKHAARTAHGRPMHKACRRTAPSWIRDGLASPRVRQMQKLIQKAAAGTTGGKRVFIVGGCSWCGTYVVSQSKYCSKKCREAASFSRKPSRAMAFSITPKARRAIYERDNWTCQLCDNPVRQDEQWPSLWSATLDHVLPQSTMLVPDHSASNLRLAHLWCNSARGDGSNMTDETLRSRVRALSELTAA